MFLPALIVLSLGIPHGISESIVSFNDGYLYFRTIGMESEEPEVPRDPATGIQIFTDGCEPEGTDLEIELWNLVMQKSWESVSTPETFFYLRAGDENLVYEDYQLVYECPEGSCLINIHPEELWSILHHTLNNSSPSTGQISVEATCPSLMESKIVFVGADDKAMRTVQVLLNRGKLLINPQV